MGHSAAFCGRAGDFSAEGVFRSAGCSGPGAAGEDSLPPLCGEWTLRKDTRSWWVLWSAAALLALVVGLILLLGGRNVQAQISDYTVEHPNLAGSVICLVLGFGVGTLGVAFMWGLYLPMLRDTVRPWAALVQFLLGHWEPVDGRFTGWVEESDGDGGFRRYPLFSLGQGRDYLCSSIRSGQFSPGDLVTLYQSPQGGFFASQSGGLSLSALCLCAAGVLGNHRALSVGAGGISAVAGCVRNLGLPLIPG